MVVTTACGMGALFGFLFGLVDVNSVHPLLSVSALSGHSNTSVDVRLAHLIDPMLCFPIGILCGGLVSQLES